VVRTGPHHPFRWCPRPGTDEFPTGLAGSGETGVSRGWAAVAVVKAPTSVRGKPPSGSGSVARTGVKLDACAGQSFLVVGGPGGEYSDPAVTRVPWCRWHVTFVIGPFGWPDGTTVCRVEKDGTTAPASCASATSSFAGTHCA